MTESASPVDLTRARRATVAGVELRYVQVGAGRPVVLLHTLRTQLDYFLPLLERLDTTRLGVVAVDLPGHGESSAPPVRYDAPVFAGAVAGLLEHCDLGGVTLVGESIGATIALMLAARGGDRIDRVVAINPYDYGRWGGIRRSSPLAMLLFTAILWPGIGPVVARSETPAILRGVLRGGLVDRAALPESLVGELVGCGRRPGHARALRSLSREWRSWIAARASYPAIRVPVTLVYGDHDWSRPAEREENARAIRGVEVVTVERCGHFASLERPDVIAEVIER